MGKITLETMLRGSQRSIRMIRNKKILESALDTKVNVTSDNLALFPELNLIVNRIKKSGNTSLVLFFHDLIGGDSLEPHAVNGEKSRRSIRGVDLSNWDNLSESKSFVCVRNPYFRAISGFLEKVGRGENTEFQAYGGYGDPTVSGFETFLDDLANSEWRSVDRHFWPQTNLFDFDLFLGFARFFIALLLFIQIFAIIHQTTDRRFGRGCDFNQV